jgi:hypothetical protein
MAEVFVANEMAIEQLSTTDTWNRLSPVLREILTATFVAGDRDLAKAVATVNPHFSTQRAEAVAAGMLADNDVRAVLLLQSGRVVVSDTPALGTLENLFRHPEWRTLEPLTIKLHADDASAPGETLDMQRILTVYFTTAREDLRAAVGMCLPHLPQESVAEVAKFLYESERVRRIFAIRKGAIRP